jgi:endonuclease V-like protein UPF0215 family
MKHEVTKIIESNMIRESEEDDNIRHILLSRLLVNDFNFVQSQKLVTL